VRHCDHGFGTPGSAEYALVKGKAYTFRLRWVATDPGYTGTPNPDYDWRALLREALPRVSAFGYGTVTLRRREAPFWGLSSNNPSCCR
ncbi:MAG: hypothetical protein PHU80_10265, partial [Kiritimatiellae bacterium]|nr:hypothetical protein [Kiritimatiellia bacterium]